MIISVSQIIMKRVFFENIKLVVMFTIFINITIHVTLSFHFIRIMLY